MPLLTRPWKFSYVILVVEGQKLHAHRGSACCVLSYIFEEMFTFNERRQARGVQNEIPIPGKMASEIIELLQTIYPFVEEKLTEKNCYRLLPGLRMNI